MSPVPGATTVMATLPTPTPSTGTSTMATTTTTNTFTSSAPNRSSTVSSQRHYSPSRAQHGNGNGNGNGNVSMAASKNKHHFNNNNSINSTNCNSNNNNNNSGKSEQSHNTTTHNNNKLTFQQKTSGISLDRLGGMQQMKQQQQQQQAQQQFNKNSSNAMNAKANDMHKQKSLAKPSSFSHATTSLSSSTVNGAAMKSVNNKTFSTPVGTSSAPPSSSSAPTNCNTKSLTTTTTKTTSHNATTATESQTADPLALPAIKCNGVTSTPAAVVATNAQTTINSTINQIDREIKDECDPQMISAKAAEMSATTTAKTIATEAAATTTTTITTTTTTTTATIVHEKTMPSTATPPTNRKDSNAATPSEARKSKNVGTSHTPTDDVASVDNLIVDKPRKVLLSVMNSHIICHLCNGYLIDATTIVECLHSFCHSCLIKHLRMEQYCPRCEMMINTVKPNIKPDTTLQAIVYKLVPGLYERELMRKRAFYKDRPEDAAMATPEQRGDDTEHLIFSPSDYMSLSLEFADTDELVRRKSDYGELLKPRYLQCPAMCTVGHLKKFVYGKFDIDAQRFDIDLMYKVKTIVLLDHYTLMDVAYIYTWKRDAPMRVYFRVKRSLRPVVKVRKPAALMPVEVKDEVPDVKPPTPIVATETAEAAITPTPAVGSDVAMTIIPKPVVTTLNTNETLITTPVDIKPEEVEVPEVGTTKTYPEASSTKHAKPSKTIKSPTVSSSTDGKQRTQVSSTSDRRAEKSHHSHSSPKTSSKEKREAKEALKHATDPPRDERKVENIKLKIDLSKHNSVTIINMSDPHRREITKPVRPEKEWKLKTKRDKDSSPKHLLSSERKSKTPSPLTVPPITIKAEQISPQMKTSPLAKYSPRLEEKSPEPAASLEDEEQKSQFLKSFSLTPIKSVKTESPDKSPQSPKRSPNTIQTHKILVKSPTSAAREPLKTTISAVYKTSALPTKRKIKELNKQMTKKPKLSPPLPVEDFKIKLPSPSAGNNATKPSATPVTKASSAASGKPPLQPARSSSNLTATRNADSTITTTASSTTSNNLAPMRPPIGVPPKKPTGKSGTSAPKLNAMAPPPLPFQRIEMSAPGNRTPIAKRYQPILPKSSRPNPFANIPSDVNRLLKDAGTEIKSIASNSKSTGKVYGPKMSGGGTTITPEDSLMLPPPSPIKTQAQNVGQTRLAGNTNKTSTKAGKSSSANNYLNLALYNASKTKGNEAPPGCRTPMYTPNSPIYSPSSPQYVPNYNIPTVPTYKYTPRPSGGSGSFLQSILGGANNQMAGLFPAPPTKKETTNTNVNSTPGGRSSPSHGGNQKSFEGKQMQAPKRVYPFARSPSPDDPPEKQLKVKSLLTSCNINIPSSLSITITREDSESPTNNASYPKHKSPVNNYIEILKLPDQSCESAESSKRASPPAPKQPQTQQSAATLKLLMPPSVNADSSTRRDSIDTSGQATPKTQNSMPAPKTSYSNAPSNPHKQTVAIQNNPTKSPHTNSKATHEQPMPIALITEPQKSPQSMQHKSLNEKRSPMHSPEKSINLSPNSKSTHKSPSSSTSTEASKKFRPILPRQSPATGISEIVLPKVTTANIIGTYSSPSGVAVKIHANKKVTPPKKSPGAQQAQQQPQNAHQQPKNGHSPNALSATKSGATQPNKSPTPAHQSSAISQNNTKSTGTTSPSSAASNNSASAKNNANKLLHSPHATMPTPLPSLPNLPAMQNLPPTPLQVAAMAAGLPGMPPHLSADFSKLFKDNLLRAQVQAAAAATQPGGMFYPYANPQQLSHHYSYQQAFMLEQLSRMQRAEAINEFMQKLKTGSAEKMALESMAANVVGGAKAAEGPKAASPVTSTANATSKSNSNKSNASAASPNSSSNNNNNINSSIGTSATKAK